MFPTSDTKETPTVCQVLFHSSEQIRFGLNEIVSGVNGQEEASVLVIFQEHEILLFWFLPTCLKQE